MVESISKNITIEICGGLGNQMFQFAFGCILERKLNCKVRYDLRYFDSSVQKDFEVRYKNQLDIFELEIQAENRPFVRSLIRKIRRIFLRESNILVEGNFDVEKFIDKPPLHRVYLRGYWQNYNYFIGYESLIRGMFEFKPITNVLYKDYLRLIKETDSVSVHVRRGDYISNPDAFKNHGVCNMNYYKSAIDLILAKNHQALFFIFSDDIEWCRENFTFGELVFVHCSSDIPAYLDMQLMSYCKNNIIANSTFSWWSAFLNRNEEKIVIAPKLWFSDKSREQEVHKIIPETWILL